MKLEGIFKLLCVVFSFGEEEVRWGEIYVRLKGWLVVGFGREYRFFNF